MYLHWVHFLMLSVLMVTGRLSVDTFWEDKPMNSILILVNKQKKLG